MSQFHFDPATYAGLMRREVPLYATLQETLARATQGVEVARLLDLGTGTGETVLAVLGHHSSARLVGVDENPAMLEVARGRLEGREAELVVADLLDPLPAGPFDLVTSALAIHHLDGPGKALLFARVADVLRPGGRFVMGDVVIPENSSDAVAPLHPGYDKPSTAAEQVEWLTAAGFVVTVVWSEGDLAVLASDRPASRR
jgi:tRNA (cmo5U34)-methyltransferase